jgi:hypothetical protein
LGLVPLALSVLLLPQIACAVLAPGPTPTFVPPATQTPELPPTPDMSTRPADFSLLYNWYEGSLPPPYHYEYSLAIGPDGAGTLTLIPDYPGPDVPVWTETFALTPADLDALYANLVALGAFSTEWEEEEGPPVGGSHDTLALTAHGQTVTIPSFVVSEQSGTQGEISAVVNGLVPPAAWATLDAQREEYVREHEE